MDLVETATRQRETGRDRQRPLERKRPCGLLLERPGCAGELGDAEAAWCEGDGRGVAAGGVALLPEAVRDGIQRCTSVEYHCAVGYLVIGNRTP